jgi:hypothetical protein
MVADVCVQLTDYQPEGMTMTNENELHQAVSESRNAFAGAPYHKYVPVRVEKIAGLA